MIGLDMRRLIACLTLTLGLAFTANASCAQAVLDANAMRAAAGESLKVGKPEQAEAIASALLARDAQDLNALLLHSRALRDLGRLKEARQEARKAWDLSKSDSDKYASALITAQVLSSEGKRTRAQFWLRRAGEHAPTSLLEARAKRDFNYVKQRNPWHTQLSFVLAPNSNVNNGSASDRSYLNYDLSKVIFGAPVEYELTGSSRALSGLEYGASISSRYRFAQTATTAHDLNVGASYRSFVLSNSASRTAPDASGSDFAFGTASLGYGYRRINFDRKGEFFVDVEAAQSWYGGNRYASYKRVSVAQSVNVSRDRRFRFAAELERQHGQTASDVETAALSASVTQRLASGNVTFFALKGTATQSPNSDTEYNGLELRGGLLLARPVMGSELRFGLGVAVRDFDVSRHVAGRRRDLKAFADMTAVFKDIDYYGFNPSATFTASSNSSDVDLFDVNRVGLSLGFQSSF
ncbi:MAG: hypothetical protein CL583_18025 [Alteromonadaceae bacterium]|nr:hypothetical protein [Alteromonadaceae bacterium]|tara:strand:+ start:5569 stop:6966 length:1398 start_codon:yes stop_codon:yes gene_type:complete